MLNALQESYTVLYSCSLHACGYNSCNMWIDCIYWLYSL